MRKMVRGDLWWTVDHSYCPPENAGIHELVEWHTRQLEALRADVDQIAKKVIHPPEVLRSKMRY